MTPHQAAARLHKRAQNLRRELQRAEEQNLEMVLETARTLSSGPFSSAELAKMGHPYAKRAPNPPADPAVLNVQSGFLRESWQKTPIRLLGARMSGKIYNTAPYSKYFDEDKYPTGTRLMIARTIQKRIREKIRKRRVWRLRLALRKGLKG